MSSRASAARDRCLELERAIAGRIRSGNLGLDDALKLFDEMLHHALYGLLTSVTSFCGHSVSLSADGVSSSMEKTILPPVLAIHAAAGEGARGAAGAFTPASSGRCTPLEAATLASAAPITGVAPPTSAASLP